MKHTLMIYNMAHKPMFWKSSNDCWKLFQLGGRFVKRNPYKFYYRVSSII